LWPEALVAAGGGEAGAGAGLDGADAVVRTAAAVLAHGRAAIEAAGPSCVAVKLQLACFERLGGPGWEALAELVRTARAHGLLTIADGKRGDVPVTARAYAEALLGGTVGPFGPLPGLGADAVTLNPLLGRDALEPFLDAAARGGAGCFCLVRTSNPGAAEVQDTGDEPLHERLAVLVDELGGAGPTESGLSFVGAVTGATEPRLLARLRALMPRAIFLLPGVGAQGGRVEDLAAAWAPHPAAGLVAASRSIVDAHRDRGGEPAVAAAAAAEELRAAAWAAAHRG
jgi:orotidine-5'-phosphate decarboxylase